MTLLDVSKLPTSAIYEGAYGTIDIGKFFDDKLRPIINLMITNGLVKDVASFGFAMAKPDVDLRHAGWDDPAQLAWFTTGWGPDRDKYIANALRKMRLAGRIGFDSIAAREEDLLDPVQSVEADGTFLWGDFPHAGAVFEGSPRISGLLLLGGCSVFTAPEDDKTSHFTLGMLELEIARVNTKPTAA